MSRKLEILINDDPDMGYVGSKFFDGERTCLDGNPQKDICLEVLCAYDHSTFCNPDCAACARRGVKFFCVRSGVDTEFEIGYTD